MAPLCAGAADSADLTSLSLDDLSKVTVQTVSRREENLDQAPNTIYVFTKEQIRERGYQRLQDLLQVIPGFGVAQRDLAMVNFIRGIAPNDNEKLTLMINGVPVNALTESQYMNGPISLDACERVEVIVGPGSVMYGSETLLATINFITRKPGENEVSGTVGTRDFYNGTAIFGKKWSDSRWFNGTATVAERGGYDAFSGTSHGTGGLANTHLEDQLEDGVFLTGQGNYDQWSLNSSLQYSKFPLLDLRQATGTGDYSEMIGDVTLRRTFDITSDWNVFAQAGYDYKSNERVSSIIAPDTYNYRLHQNVFSAEMGTEWDPTDKTVVQAGIQAKYENNTLGDYYANPINVPPGYSANGIPLYSEDTYSVGAYASAQHRFTDWFQAVVAGRVDHNTILPNTDAEYGGRAGLIFTPLSNWTSKLTYNRATRVPTPWMSPINTTWGSGGSLASYYNDPNVPGGAQPWFAGNPVATEPEILTTYEWDNIVYFGKTRVSLGAYYQNLQNFMSWNNPFTNVGDFAGPGLETEINTPICSNLDAFIGGSAQKTHVRTDLRGAASNGTGVTIVPGTDNQVGVPRFLAHAGLDWHIVKNVSLTLQGRLLADDPICYNESVSSATVTVNRFYLDTALLWRDAMVKNLDVRLAVNNVLNERGDLQAQWQGYTYKPDGIEVSFSAYYRF